MKYRWFRDKKLFGLVDSDSNEVVIPAEYEQLGTVYTNSGLLKAQKNELYGFIDIDNRTIIPFSYKYAGDFTDGLAPVQIGDKFGYIDTGNNLVIPARYRRANSFFSGLATVENESGQYDYINKSGEILNKASYKIAWDFKGGFAVVSTDSSQKDQFNLIDTNFNKLFEEDVSRFEYFKNSIYRVWIRNKFDIIEEKAFDASQNEFLDIPSKSAEWKEAYDEAANILYSEIVEKLSPCYCRYPRILDLFKSKQSEEAQILLPSFFRGLKDIDSKQIDNDKWRVKKVCPVCSSKHVFEIWEYRSTVTSYLESDIDPSIIKGSKPLPKAPSYLNAKRIEINNWEEDFNRMDGNTLYRSNMNQLVEYLQELTINTANSK